MNRRAAIWLVLLLGAEILFVALAGPLAARTAAAFSAAHGAATQSALPVIVPWCAQSAGGVLFLVWGLVAVIGVCGWQISRALAGGRNALLFLLSAQFAAALVLCFSRVSFSTDTYNYVVWGRLAGIYQVDPYLDTTTAHNLDGVIRLCLFATGDPPPRDDYGPLWTELAGLIALAQKSANLWSQLFAHRLVAVLAALAASAALLRILRHKEPTLRLRATATFAFHPVVLYEAAVGGHNDIIMVALALWSYALVDDYPLIAGVLLGASIAIKYISALLLPFLFIRACRHGRAAPFLMTAVAAAIVVVTFVPLWHGIATLAATFARGNETAMSPMWLAGVAAASLGAGNSAVGGAAAIRAIQALMLVAVAVVIVFSVATYRAQKLPGQIWRSVAAVVLASPVLQPWYALWVSPAVASSGTWAVYAWWLGALIFLRYALDAGIFGACDLDVWPLYAIAGAIIAVPVVVSLAARRRA